MPSLVVPGVRVEARFDVLPPPLAPSGVVGVVGIADRPPASGLTGVSRPSELRELLGPGTEGSMPEAVHALSNGAGEVVVSAVGGGSSAFVDLNNDDSVAAVRLRARSKGTWSQAISVDVRETRDGSNKILRSSLRLLRGGRTLEEFPDLQVKLGAVDDLFDAINLGSRYVVAIDPGLDGAMPAEGTFAFTDAGTPLDVNRASSTDKLLQLGPSSGAQPSGLSVVIDTEDSKIEVRVFQRGLQERFTGLTMDPDDANYLPFVLAAQSQLIRARTHPSRAEDKRLPRAISAPVALAGATSPQPADWQAAIERFADDPRIDLVVAAVEPTMARTDVLTIHQALVAHAVTMAADGAPRIVFGSITPGEQDGTNDADEVREHAATARNRRFVLVAPAGAAGAVAGVVARMNPEDSPTFKSIPLFGIPPARYRASELNRLLGPANNVAVVQDRVGRGVVLLRGIDTTGDQISVTRVADQAIRETKAIAENFIGQLNSDDARAALKGQIVATFTRMANAGALVPSTDGSDPPFLIDVYSTQQDFAQGIVRIDIACRPARAIDYVYAQIRVKN